MKFVELKLTAFGPFTDVRLDLSPGEYGLHLVYGANEAGKSSALRAIYALLYGFPRGRSDDFLHPQNNLQVAATIISGGGESLSFTRRKGRKGSLSRTGQPNTTLSDEALQTYLGGVDRETFCSVYGIGHLQLRQGGALMQSLQGLAGESLFAATVGGPGVVEVLGVMEREAQTIYAGARKKSRLRESETKFKELQAEKKLIRLTASVWERRKAELDAAQCEYDRLKVLESESEAAASRLDHYRSAQQHLGRRRQAQAELDKLRDVTVLPAEYDAEQRVRIECDLQARESALQQLAAKLAGPDSLPARLEAIVIPDGLLPSADQMERLIQDVRVHIKNLQNQQSLRQECELARDRVARLRNDLRATVAGTSENAAEKPDPDIRGLTSDEQARVAALASDARPLREQPRQLRRQYERLADEQKKKQAELTGLGAARDFSVLRQAVRHVERMGDLQEECDLTSAAHREAQQAAEQCRSQLAFRSGTWEETRTVRLPLAETVLRFEKDLAALQKTDERLVAKADELIRERTAVQTEIAALQQTGHVPTEAELRQLRQRRDNLWRQLRESESITIPVASEFEAAVAEADLMADRLRREADRVARLASSQASLERIATSLEENGHAVQQNQARHDDWRRDWTTQWLPTGISEPLGPAEMREWMGQLRELQKLASEVGRKQEELEKRQQRLVHARQSIVSAWRAFADATEDERSLGDWSLEALLEGARELLAGEDRLAESRQRLAREIGQFAAGKEKCELDLAAASEELVDWESQWRPMMERLGLEPAATAEQASARVARLLELNQIQEDIREKQQRIESLENDLARFADQARQLADRFLPAEAQQLPATEIAARLTSLLDQAKRDQMLRERLMQELDEAGAAQESARQARIAAQRQLDRLLNLAGAVDTSQLPELESKSRDRKRWQDQFDSAEQALHELAGNVPLHAFVASASELPPEELTARRNELERELKEIRHRREEALASLRSCEAGVRAIDGSSRVAEIEEESLGIVSSMQEQATQYMQLRLAHHMLSQQIEVYRAENEDPLLARASQLFSHMTCGEFYGLQTATGADDKPVIVGVRGGSGGECVYVDQMSDGTCDQLFLALRLAYLEQMLDSHEPLPFIVDDILIHFDNDRARATLEVLAELSQRTQVIFFTHHIHLTEIAAQRLSPDEHFVHDLSGLRLQT